IEQRVVTLLMEVAHFGRGLHVAANPGARQIAPVTVVTGADVQDHEVAVTNNPVGSETPVGSSVRTGADDVGALRPFTAHRRHGLPDDGQNFAFLNSGAQSLQAAMERR